MPKWLLVLVILFLLLAGIFSYLFVYDKGKQQFDSILKRSGVKTDISMKQLDSTDTPISRYKNTYYINGVFTESPSKDDTDNWVTKFNINLNPFNTSSRVQLVFGFDNTFPVTFYKDKLGGEILRTQILTEGELLGYIEKGIPAQLIVSFNEHPVGRGEERLSDLFNQLYSGDWSIAGDSRLLLLTSTMGFITK